MSTIRMVKEDTYMVRLVNNYKEGKSCKVRVFDKEIELNFGKYEVKTLIYKGGQLAESDSMLYL